MSMMDEIRTKRDEIYAMSKLIRNLGNGDRDDLLGRCDLRTKRGKAECVNAVWDQALDVIRKTGRASVAHFQRQLCISYTVAVSLVDELEKRGIVGPHRLGRREIFIETGN